jgi:S1-C subfamily serine protease
MTSLVVSCCLLVSLGAGPGPPQQAAPGSKAGSAAEIVTALETVISDAIAKAEPAVVAIHRYKAENSQETQAVRGRARRMAPRELDRRFRLDGRLNRFTEPRDFISFDFGSGVVVAEHGEILTAFHVVRGARELIVRATERQEFQAEVVAADPRSDLAVIAPVRFPDVEPPRLKPISMGDTARLRKGAFLISLGNAFNAARDGKPSASWGILSNLARRLDLDQDEAGFPKELPRLPNYPTLLQLDAKLNLGMSGGAVINLNGELVGLTTMAASPAGFDAQAGYAIPMDRLGRRAVQTLIQGKEIEYGFLGIKADSGYTNRVAGVLPNSPAALAQLQVDDEIVAVNDAPVVDFDTLILAVNAYSAGDTVRLKIRRGDDPLERTVVLAKSFVDGEVIVTNRPKPWRGLRVDYTSILNYRVFGPSFLDANFACVVVTEVESGSSAAAAGLKKGQLIRRVGDKLVTTPPAFRQAVADLEGPVSLDTDIGPVTIKP